MRFDRGAGGRERNRFVYDLDWDEDERFGEWRAVLREFDSFPPVLQATVAIDAWNLLEVLQHAPWLGWPLAASLLRQAGTTTGAHLAAINLGLKTIPVDRLRHRDRETRLLAILGGITASAENRLKEHDRLVLAGKSMERRLIGRRQTSKLPELIELVMFTAAGVHRDGCQGNRGDDTGGDTDRRRARAQGDDGEGGGFGGRVWFSLEKLSRYFVERFSKVEYCRFVSDSLG